MRSTVHAKISPEGSSISGESAERLQKEQQPGHTAEKNLEPVDRANELSAKEHPQLFIDMRRAYKARPRVRQRKITASQDNLANNVSVRSLHNRRCLSLDQNGHSVRN